MKKNQKLKLLLMVSLTTSLIAFGCDSGDDDPAEGDSDPRDSENDNNTASDEEPAECAIDIMEDFEGGIPAGWTILGGGGTGSGSGTGSGGDTGGDPTKTWHHTTVDDETLAPEEVGQNMSGGIMKAGDVSDMPLEVTLATPNIEIGSCASASLSFKQSFQDLLDDKGEVLIAIDGPNGTSIKTFDTSGYSEESIDLTSYLTGGSYFQIQFVFTSEDTTSMPWYLDDVTITGAE